MNLLSLQEEGTAQFCSDSVRAATQLAGQDVVAKLQPDVSPATAVA